MKKKKPEKNGVLESCATAVAASQRHQPADVEDARGSTRLAKRTSDAKSTGREEDVRESKRERSVFFFSQATKEAT
jgi:hypothetical protein